MDSRKAVTLSLVPSLQYYTGGANGVTSFKEKHSVTYSPVALIYDLRGDK